MGLWTIRGGKPLYGTTQVQGSKNGALAILAGCLVMNGVSVLENVPQVTEVEWALHILRALGCKVKREGDQVTVDSRNASMESLPITQMEKLRSSVLFLGAMLARFGKGAVPVPTGSVLGPRPLDLHLSALQSIGAEILLEDGMVLGKAERLLGGEVFLPYPSVGATENAMLAACGCLGTTVIRGCAKEPEVSDLAAYLRACGMGIFGDGTDTVCIKGQKTVEKVVHRVLPDRIAASMLLCAAASCGGKLNLQEVHASHLQPVLDGLTEMGCNIKIHERGLSLASDGKLWASAGPIVTGPYPAFPTDALPFMIAASLKADSVTVFRERVFGGRLRQMRLLRRFGGDLSLTEDCAAVVTGVSKLNGAAVCCHEPLEAGAMLLAALQAEGESTLVEQGQIRGSFVFLDAVLRQLGAELEFTQ
ncbi:MAG: UDP-N-acetylglucosamine 1-carboxyvinyltransferase [Oscillospiraceae bacterium]|nr:UDP-N-acetylglucosamine 1-carboxyvinyltransferase [Oscillospiraceae bacterium]